MTEDQYCEISSLTLEAIANDWTEIKTSLDTHKEVLEREEWCQDNCKGRFVPAIFGMRFENDMDAIAFGLKFT